jgi:hypothetical protein
MVELLCESKSGSPPILYSFYLDGKMLRNDLAPHGRAISLLFRVKSEQDAGNYSCEARNNVSRERSEPKELSLNGMFSPNQTSWLGPDLTGSCDNPLQALLTEHEPCLRVCQLNVANHCGRC